jgi:transcription initiation factor IIE alpha subunit
MSKLVETLRLKEIAEEDIYFARRDQELIQALHNQRLAEAVAAATRKNRRLARTFEKQYRKVNRACRKEPLMLIRAIRRLLDRILVAFHLAGKPPE